jgi:hypothetical protein
MWLQVKSPSTEPPKAMAGLNAAPEILPTANALLRRVSASPKLARALKQQLVAIEAIRRLDTLAPPNRHERIQRAVWEACATQQSALSAAMTTACPVQGHGGRGRISGRRL